MPSHNKFTFPWNSVTPFALIVSFSRADSPSSVLLILGLAGITELLRQTQHLPCPTPPAPAPGCRGLQVLAATRSIPLVLGVLPLCLTSLLVSSRQSQAVRAHGREEVTFACDKAGAHLQLPSPFTFQTHPLSALIHSVELKGVFGSLLQVLLSILPRCGFFG